MRETIAWWMVCIAGLLVGGCTSVYVTEPIGYAPIDLTGSESEWAGHWRTGEDNGVFLVEVANATNGVLQLGWIEGSGTNLEVETATVHLRETGDWQFATLDEGDGAETNETPKYTWGRVVKNKDTILVMVPIRELFAEQIVAGTLPGTTNGNTIVEGTLSSNHYRIICSDSSNVMFHWAEPMMFRRVE